jgi:hypothetical protein
METIEAPGTLALCKARNQLFSTGRGISMFGKQVASGEFTCLKYDEDLSMLFSGDRSGNLHIFKI